MLAATVATLSSASKRPAPSSASPSGTTLAQGSQSQPPQRSHTCQNSSPPAPVRPNRHRFCPCYQKGPEAIDVLETVRHAWRHVEHVARLEWLFRAAPDRAARDIVRIRAFPGIEEFAARHGGRV